MSQKEPKIICRAEGESTVNNSTVTGWLGEFCSNCKNFGDKARSGRSKWVNFVVDLQAVKANQARSSWRVSGDLSVVRHFHDLNKSS